jgi:small subunit ribosomal protein S11
MKKDVSKDSQQMVVLTKDNTSTSVVEESIEPLKVVRLDQPSAQDLLKDEVVELKVRKAKGSKNITEGICTVLSTYNNTKVTFTDGAGNVISWSSAGKCSFKGSRKSTAYAAQVVTQDAARVALSHGMKDVIVRLKGAGMGRDSAVRAVQAVGFNILSVMDVTPVPHNGCRPPKRRRI